MVNSLRIVAALLGAAWAVPGFGIVDLSVVVLPSEWAADAAPLAASWGSLVLFFLAVPFFAVAVRPALAWGACALAALAAVALALASVLTAYPPLLLLAGSAAVTAAVVAVLATLATGAARARRIPPLSLQISVHWPLLVLGIAGIALWIPYTANAVAAFGVLPSDVTLGLDHWPAQAAAGIAIACAGITTGLFPQLRSQAVAACALSAAAIGIVTLGHTAAPQATETALWGALALLWAVGVALACTIRRPVH